VNQPLAKHYSYVQLKIGEALPFEDGSIDFVTAFDFLEHLPRTYIDLLNQEESPVVAPARNLFIDILNEVFRVLRPSGTFLALTPAFPSPSAFVDPTHVNFITQDTHRYFSGDSWARNLGYGFEGSFECVLIKWVSHRSPLFRNTDRTSLENNPRLSTLAASDIFAHLKKRPARRSHLLWVLRKPCDSPNGN
jgi:SAM-dependent methyltransferase